MSTYQQKASETAPCGEKDGTLRLGHCRRGWRGRVSGLMRVESSGIPWEELERRLLEMGFVEGARIEVLHEGPIKRDPIAIRVDESTVAIRRADALAIAVNAAGVN